MTIPSGTQEFIAINADFKATLRRCRNVLFDFKGFNSLHVMSGASAGKPNKMDSMELHVLRRSGWI